MTVDPEAFLAQVVMLGDEPTPQATALAEAVAAQVRDRPPVPPPDMTFGERLCKAWGLDERKVYRITIDIEPDRPPVATVSLYLDGPALELAVRQYRLEARKEGE